MTYHLRVASHRQVGGHSITICFACTAILISASLPFSSDSTLTYFTTGFPPPSQLQPQGGGGEVLLEIFADAISHTRFQTFPQKFIPVFRPDLVRD